MVGENRDLEMIDEEYFAEVAVVNKKPNLIFFLHFF
jgi:hypothetical protein